MEEIRRRSAQIARGEARLLDEDEVFARIEARRAGVPTGDGGASQAGGSGARETPGRIPRDEGGSDVAKTIEELEGELLSLPDDARARLAQKLLASLDDEDDVESAWYDEAERRIADYEASGEEPMSIEAFIAELRSERR